jgi:hypothetical protein
MIQKCPVKVVIVTSQERHVVSFAERNGATHVWIQKLNTETLAGNVKVVLASLTKAESKVEAEAEENQSHLAEW